MKANKETILLLILFLAMSIPASCQFENGISGMLLDESGNGIPGANILLKGTTIGIITDAEGKFSFNTLPSSTLVISQIGYQNYEFTLSAGNNFSANNINLMLSESGIRKKYWCCTSHQPLSTHCNMNRSMLRLNHDPNEIYKIKNPRN